MAAPKALVAVTGCKLNQAEAYLWKAWFEAEGCEVTAGDGETQPDICLVTTCTVTGQADRSSVSLVRRLHRKYPNARIKVSGCGASNIPERFSALPGVTEIIDYAEKERRIGGLGYGSDEARAQCIERNRAFLRVGDGCDRRCAYCIVSRIRGPVKSKNASEVLAELCFLAEKGFGEVVLVALNLGLWGSERGESLAGLVKLITDESRKLPRVRLTSLEPDTITDELIEVMTASDRICPHFHIPLQSGDDAVLARMNRPYTVRDYAALVQRILKASPDACLGSDVITSVPGEDEASFARTAEFVGGMPFSHLHVFTYSPRQGTPMADEMEEPGHSLRERTRLLREVGERKSFEFRRRFIGRLREAVLQGSTRALTDNYIDIRIPATSFPVRSLVTVEIEEIEADHTRGRIL